MGRYGWGRVSRPLNKKERQEVYRQQNGICNYCGLDVAEGCYEVDHIIPVSKGGTNEKQNLRLSCDQCNWAKRDLGIAEFRLKAAKFWIDDCNEFIKKLSFLESQNGKAVKATAALRELVKSLRVTGILFHYEHGNFHDRYVI